MKLHGTDAGEQVPEVMDRKYWKYRTLVAGIDQYGRFLALGVFLALGQDLGQVGDRIAWLRLAQAV